MKNVEDLIVESLVNVVNLCCINQVTNTKPSNLVFPVHSNGTRRVSEQEARFLFVQAVEQDKQFLYSVEAPTKLSYFFGAPVPVIVQDGQDGQRQAGNIDACLYENGERKHLIEFKALNPPQISYSKDFLKLICDERGLTNYFVHVLENPNPNINGIYQTAIAHAQAQAQLHSLKQSQLVIFLCVMQTREITRYSEWDNVNGNWNKIEKKTVK
ncbi:MAG: hypothetical protein MdMp024_0341 [Bacteroidales bacterium]